MAILTARKTTKRFGGLVDVDELDVEIQENSIHSIIGPNGAGKTTFFNCVTGFYRPEVGEILLNNHSLVGLLPDQIVRLGIARTYQNIRLFPNLTAIENVLVGLHCHLKAGFVGIVLSLPATQKEEKESDEEARRLLKFVNLAGKGDFLAKNLPYGDQRRLEIARALAVEPKLLLLDEPMAGMNLEEKEDMARFIIDIHELKQIPIVLVEHDMEVVMDIAEKLVVLDFGKKIAEGEPEEIRQNPLVIRAYLGEEETPES